VTQGDAAGGLTLDGSDVLTPGQASVGVKRQDGDAVGTRANGQAGVFVGSASSVGSPLLERRLSVPPAWVEEATDEARRRTGGGPGEIVCQTKPQLGGEMIREGLDEQRWRCRWLTWHEAYGRDTDVLDQVAHSGLGYVAAGPQDTRVWQRRPKTAVPRWSGRGRQPTWSRLGAGQPGAEAVSTVAAAVPALRWTHQVLHESPQGPIVAALTALRVVAVHPGWPGPQGWLVLRCYVDTGELQTSVGHATAATALETLGRLSGMRWPLETGCEDGQPYLGMGDDEGRRWRGWHPHRTLCLLAHVFLVRPQPRLQNTCRP
jgi:SRSO17 transposase